MTAFFVATSKINDPQKFADYAAKAGPTFEPFGGALVIRGKAEDSLVGASEHHVVGVVRFADMATLKAWYRSPDYQALIPLRDEAAQMTLTTYQVPGDVE